MGNSSWFEGCGLSDRASGKVGLFVSRFTILTAGLTLAFGVLPLKVAAQAAAPSTGAESSVQLKQPLVSGQSTPSITVTLRTPWNEHERTTLCFYRLFPTQRS